VIAKLVCKLLILWLYGGFFTVIFIEWCPPRSRGLSVGDFTVSKYGNIMGMQSNVTKDNHENGNMVEDIMGKKKKT